MNKGHINKFIADIEKEAQELRRLLNLTPDELINEYLSTSEGPTIQELEISELIGHPVRIKK